MAGHCDAALTGELDINAVLRLMIEASEQPLSPFADMDESDEDGLVYPLTGLPEGLQGHLRFGNPEVFDGEFRLRTAYIVLEGKDLEPEFVQGALRRPASASFSCAWSDGDPGHARWSDLALQRSPDLAASKRTGINAHEGTWTTGLSWRQDLRGDGSGLQTSPTGMVQGNPSNDPAAFGGAPIRGQLEPDPALVQQLFERLLEQRRRAQGQ
ncbi:MAG: hypothetical protein R3F17_04200 [Planctomycetota bacterium]